MDMTYDDGEPENLPSEYRILKWDDGDYSIHEVYFKDGKPFSYNEEALAHAENRAELEAAMAEIMDGIAQAAKSEILDEAKDFPGQYRWDSEVEMAAWLERQSHFQTNGANKTETQETD